MDLTKHSGSDPARSIEIIPQGIHEISRFRVLLAEDNLVNQKIAQTILTKGGHQVDVVSNGLEAVRALEQIDYDLVLMDCQMPVLDGYAATATIRNPQSNVLNHAVPIIAMTASTTEGARERCLSAGMTDYLAKPIDSLELTSKVANVCRQPKKKKCDGRPAGLAPLTDAHCPDGEAVLDTALALDLMDGDRATLRVMLSIVHDQMTADRREIAQAINEQDTVQVQRTSHRLKGSVGQIGAVRAQTVCALLDASAARGDLSTIGDLQQRLESELDALAEAIASYLAQYPVGDT